MTDVVTDNEVFLVAEYFHCEHCDYKCSKKGNFNKHLLTSKHKFNTNTDGEIYKVAKIYDCDCGKKYKHRQSLFTHKKKCDYEAPEQSFKLIVTEQDETNSNGLEDYDPLANIDEIDDINEIGSVECKAMLFKMMKENSEFRSLLIKQQEQIGELIPKIGNNNNNNNNVNNKFNINVFLNEQCNNAINLTDFIDNIEISMANLDITRYKGLAEGLSCIIMENMSNISLYERPIHCTDIKREAVYIRNKNVWSKDRDKLTIKKAINDISIKQFKTLQAWTHKNPNFKDDDNKTTYFTQALLNVSKDPKTVDDKVIKRLCSNYYLKENLLNNNSDE